MRNATATRALEALEYAISSGRDVGVASKILAKYSAKLRFFQVHVLTCRAYCCSVPFCGVLVMKALSTTCGLFSS